MMETKATETWLERRLPVGIVGACLAAWGLNTLLFGAGDALVKGVWLGLIGLYLLAVAWLVLRKTKLRNGAIPLLLAAGFLMQFLFVLRKPYDFSWHDLGRFGSLTDGQAYAGHLGLINYLVKFGRLPMENPLLPEFKDFYHPPLYHMMQAGFFKINLLLGIPQEAALENLQILTLCFASLCLWLVYRILRQLGLSDRGTRTGVLFAVFQPVFFIYAGTLNNDIVSVFFILLTVLCTLRWAQAPTLRRIIHIALALGLGMAVKLSVAVIAVSVGLVFAVRFFQNLSSWKRYVTQFLTFLLISVPIGTAWPIFHAIAFQMPLSHVPLPSESINVGHLPFSMRFGLPDNGALHSLFYSGIRKMDYNVWFQTLKTALFDELTLFPEGSRLWYASYLLAALFTALVAVSVVLFCRWIIKKQPAFPPLYKLFFSVYGAALLGSYLSFCIQYPYICTFNFRYIMPSLLLCALGLAAFAEKPSLPGRLVEALIWAFGGLSCFVYGGYLLG